MSKENINKNNNKVYKHILSTTPPYSLTNVNLKKYKHFITPNQLSVFVTDDSIIVNNENIIPTETLNQEQQNTTNFTPKSMLPTYILLKASLISSDFVTLHQGYQ